ncbi:chromate transporter [Caldibacillus lycopersici]|uniref:Chromate transporter n=1 Tax=Perspicuibacillus lycopersici TaxID=1325689 RepID=A0AAE3LLZ2_9BACI|nr:chromate transporter [Perspicuibacillus lycopersici]MCU9612970.1 chromate transporter [Perspicuibacillus lycopersici]
MIYWQIFLAFFIPGILGYGGGPASIPLVENEVVDRYQWMNHQEFSEMIALANALPGPIATKMAGYVGYMEGGIFGSAVGLFATVAPSLILMIALLSLILKHKDSPKVKRMSNYVRPAIAVLMGILTYDFFFDSFHDIGGWQTFGIALISLLLLEKWKVHPVYVISGAIVYGAFFLS